MSIFQLGKKIINNLKSYVYYPEQTFGINHIENMILLRENSDKCVVINHTIERNNIKKVDDKTIDVYVKTLCDIVFDFEIFDPVPHRSELLCDDIVIHKNVDNINYENAFPTICSATNIIKIRLYYNEEVDVKDIQITCKYGLLPLDIKRKLQELDIHKICYQRKQELRRQEEWVFC